ncbi:ATP-dependent zinc metalloprotease YME1L-like [Paramacrobiotus metropolitanus]|uniref:ATP-dependent zinc metalloprotease YME1L-like n=1 Tax=Paramacrobiotus metropolitanus TaxID=2943436 RepID=UPI002445F031|nr:ATP-dependent zinc metalloprotease YME1L-like [Paramacrobiotus metropolitanus]
MISEGFIGGSQLLVLLGNSGLTWSLRALHWLNCRSQRRTVLPRSTDEAQSPRDTYATLLSSLGDLSPQDLLRSLEIAAPGLLDVVHPRVLTPVGTYLGSGPLPLDVGLLTRRTAQGLLGATQSTRSFTTRKRNPKTLGGGTKTAEESLQDILGERGGLLSNWLRKAKLIDKAPLKIVTDEHIKKYMATDSTLSQEDFNKVRLAFLEGYLASNDQKAKSGNRAPLLLRFFSLAMSAALLAVVLVMISNTMSFRVMMGLSPHEVTPEDVSVTFNDVKGVDEAKEELMQIVEYLKNPERFGSLGGKLPKGVLLVGPPGTGKTLLARAVAGEAGVPFFQVAGSEFDEILVGQGARRVRELFAAAKERAPCVIFIDEIDAVGSKRTNSVLHPHANQTINQLLAEMDGFHQTQSVIVLGATNRQDDLDKALTRPGRFDVEVHVPMPDLKGRSEILRYYLDKMVLAADVQMEVLARGTSGFTGADIENMVNQAALSAASDGLSSVTMEYLERARDKVLMGPAKKTKVPDEEANQITAYHEGGHTLVAHFTKDSMPLHKVTIVPRGPSLGHTAYIPEKEMYHHKKSEMLAMLDTLLAGRVAEELIFGPDYITSGASDDLKKASELASRMVKMFGMSEKVGLRYYGDDDERSVFSAGKDLAPTTAEAIDAEIKKILQDSYERARNILKQHAKEHRLLAEALLEYETLDADDIRTVISGKILNKKKVL